MPKDVCFLGLISNYRLKIFICLKTIQVSTSHMEHVLWKWLGEEGCVGRVPHCLAEGQITEHLTSLPTLKGATEPVCRLPAFVLQVSQCSAAYSCCPY